MVVQSDGIQQGSKTPGDEVGRDYDTQPSIVIHVQHELCCTHTLTIPSLRLLYMCNTSYVVHTCSRYLTQPLPQLNAQLRRLIVHDKVSRILDLNHRLRT